METRVEVREYVVTAWPANLPTDEGHLWEVSVHRTRIPDMWAVTLRGGDLPILTRRGNWSWTMPRSLRVSCYMPLEEALAAAVIASQEIKVNGWTVAAAIANRERLLPWNRENECSPEL